MSTGSLAAQNALAKDNAVLITAAAFFLIPVLGFALWLVIAGHANDADAQHARWLAIYAHTTYVPAGPVVDHWIFWKPLVVADAFSLLVLLYLRKQLPLLTQHLRGQMNVPLWALYVATPVSALAALPIWVTLTLGTAAVVGDVLFGALGKEGRRLTAGAQWVFYFLVAALLAVTLFAVGHILLALNYTDAELLANAQNAVTWQSVVLFVLYSVLIVPMAYFVSSTLSLLALQSHEQDVVKPQQVAWLRSKNIAPTPEALRIAMDVNADEISKKVDAAFVNRGYAPGFWLAFKGRNGRHIRVTQIFVALIAMSIGGIAFTFKTAVYGAFLAVQWKYGLAPEVKDPLDEQYMQAIQGMTIRRY